MSFDIALSGLNAATTDLDVIGNNIANAGTSGFKESRAEFATLYANAIQDASVAGGQGVRVARVAQQFTQGSVDFTSNNLDLALAGQGFFVTEAPDGTRSYTRAGAFSVDREGNVVNHANDRLQVYEANIAADGTTTFNTGVLQDLVLPTTPSTPNPTTEVDASLNLNSTLSAPGGVFDPDDPTTYNSSTSVSVYDTLGNPHTSTLYFRKTAANTWEGYQYVDGTNVTSGGAAAFPLTFSSSGALTAPAGGTVTMDAHVPAGGGGALNMTLGFSGTTQYGSDFAVNNLSQDGYSSGRLAGVDIDTDGVVFARYTNGQSSPLGKVALAKFNNEQGLRQIGDTAWAESYESGNVQLGEAGTSSFGQVQSGALEASNVDIAEQLVRLITAQRNFQANSEAISANDQVTQSIINIR